MALIITSSDLAIDATLTKRGRELLSSGNGNFNITKFAVSDDEINYSLSEDDIEALPLREASINGDVEMRYKLVSNTNSDTLIMAKITNISFDSGTLISNGSVIIEPSTNNGGDAEIGYVCTITNIDDSTFPSATIEILGTSIGGITNSDYTASGLKFKIVAKTVTSTKNVNVTIVGRATGAQKIFTLAIDPDPSTQQQIL